MFDTIYSSYFIQSILIVLIVFHKITFALFDRDSCTYTYLLGDFISKTAVIIDPVIELSDRDADLIRQLGLTLIFCLNTHMHADHITGTGRLKQHFPKAKSVIGCESGAQADCHVNDGDCIKFGPFCIRVLTTPGHTTGCVTYVLHSRRMCFTGDCLLIRGCGRTDFQGGCSDTMYDSVHDKLFMLPDDYTVYPAHDYKGQTCSTIGEERRFNPRLTHCRPDFNCIMAELNLPYPAKFDVAVPANRTCGLHDIPAELAAKLPPV